MRETYTSKKAICGIQFLQAPKMYERVDKQRVSVYNYKGHMVQYRRYALLKFVYSYNF